jgi:hypothetical protein
MDYTPFVFILAMPLMIVVQVYLLVLKMSKPEQMLRPIPGGLSADRQEILLAYRDWLAAVNLEYLTSFQFGSIQVAVFQQPGTQRFFSFYFHKTLSYSIESRFDDRSFFETGTSGGMGMFPARPGAYRQSFPRARADEAWQRHLEAEDYLMKKFGLAWQPLSGPYEAVLINSLRLTMNYVRSIPLWPFRSLYWYAVSRSRLANKSVQQLYP